MSRITTHILDQSKGRPAAGVEVVLSLDGIELSRTVTNVDGRVAGWTVDGSGVYRLRFETGAYYKGETFYPFVEISFELHMEAHYHVPLLLSPWGYSTYRGS